MRNGCTWMLATYMKDVCNPVEYLINIKVETEIDVRIDKYRC